MPQSATGPPSRGAIVRDSLILLAIAGALLSLGYLRAAALDDGLFAAVGTSVLTFVMVCVTLARIPSPRDGSPREDTIRHYALAALLIVALCLALLARQSSLWMAVYVSGWAGAMAALATLGLTGRSAPWAVDDEHGEPAG